ncbi:MARVEL domain-containing protein 3 [Hypomesus transpacificus]|uniref:MARVEL domain-containing protein 3 n=1 Tax=Hypomesus transpacificus TaxID=137520 RepID=UPI001F08018A|nr:MARVEL domain-containing protein 3 [Hypomesus transpacificus]XP_046898194.1 MARVEL domain-containing protein 3 [Hypomesus transpacificus]
MPERSQYTNRVESERPRRERDSSHDRERSRYEGREWERERNGDHGKRERRERSSGNDISGREKDYYERQRDTTSFSSNDPTDHRSSHLQEYSEQYTDGSRSPSDQHYEHREAVYNLRYILTSRGLCQIIELVLNLLIIICAGVPYSNSGGYRDLASYGGIYQYYFGGANAFAGAEADRVKELDQLFHQLKLPPYIFSMACGGALMTYACVMLALGVLRVTYRWPPVLLAETLLNLLIGLGYIPALVFYFIKIKATYDNPICKEREQLYKSKGHQGFECQYNGADIAVGLFGILGVIVFPFGALFAIRAFRAVRETKKQKAEEGINL